VRKLIEKQWPIFKDRCLVFWNRLTRAVKVGIESWKADSELANCDFAGAAKLVTTWGKPSDKKKLPVKKVEIKKKIEVKGKPVEKVVGPKSPS